MHGFQIVNVIPAHASASGGACYFCHTGQRANPAGTLERVLDLGIEIETEGVPYMCESCVKHAAHLFGFISTEEADELQTEISLAQNDAAVAEARAEQAEAELGTVREAVALLKLPVAKAQAAVRKAAAAKVEQPA